MAERGRAERNRINDSSSQRASTATPPSLPALLSPGLRACPQPRHARPQGTSTRCAAPASSGACSATAKQASGREQSALPEVVRIGRELAASGHVRLSEEQRISVPHRGSAAAQIRPTQQRAGAPSGAPGLLLCQEAGVSPCAVVVLSES